MMPFILASSPASTVLPASVPTGEGGEVGAGVEGTAGAAAGTDACPGNGFFALLATPGEDGRDRAAVGMATGSAAAKRTAHAAMIKARRRRKARERPRPVAAAEDCRLECRDS